MINITADDIRSFLIEKFRNSLLNKKGSPLEICDDFDLLEEGIIDSLGVLEMIGSIEKHFDIEIDFEELDVEDLTVIGPLCKFIEYKCINTN